VTQNLFYTPLLLAIIRKHPVFFIDDSRTDS